MENPRAWLYRAARNLLIDEYRTTREFVDLEDDAPLTDPSTDAISTLDICLPETLQALPEDERWLIEESDLNRRPQQSLADDPEKTKVIIVTLAETTPVLEAANLQQDLRRAEIEPWAWVINSSLAAAKPSSPLLVTRASRELPLINDVAEQFAKRIALTPLQNEEPVGAALLAKMAG